MANYNNLLEKLSKTEFVKTEREFNDGKILVKFEARHAVLIYKNFNGVETDYNEKGKRNFCLVVTKEVADLLYANGINVKVKTPEEGEPIYLVKVNVNMESETAPEVKLYVRKQDGRTNVIELDADSIGLLDKATIETWAVDLNIYRNAKRGTVSFYLNSLGALQNDVPKFGGMFDEYENNNYNDDLPFEDVTD